MDDFSALRLVGGIGYLLFLLFLLLLFVFLALAPLKLYGIHRTLKEILAELRTRPGEREAPPERMLGDIGSRSGMGRTVAIALGILVLVVGAAMIVPNLLPGRAGSADVDENLMVLRMRSLSTAAVQYGSTYGGAPPSLRALGPPEPGGARGPQAADLLDAVTTSGKVGGYMVEYTVERRDRRGRVVQWSATAVPADAARRSFFVDYTGVIRQEYSGARPGPHSPLIT